MYFISFVIVRICFGLKSGAVCGYHGNYLMQLQYLSESRGYHRSHRQWRVLLYRVHQIRLSLGQSFFSFLCSVFSTSSSLFKGGRRVFFWGLLKVFWFASSYTLLLPASGFQNQSVLLQRLATGNDFMVLWSFPTNLVF